MGGDESNEKRFRRVYREALSTELGPALLAFGFAGEKGGFAISWNDELDFAVIVRESKWNKFGSTKFEVLVSVWMMETESRRVRWIWKPDPNGGWTFETDESIDGLGQHMIDAVFRSAMPLALDAFGPPTDERVAELAGQTSLGDARALGDGSLMSWDS